MEAWWGRELRHSFFSMGHHRALTQGWITNYIGELQHLGGSEISERLLLFGRFTHCISLVDVRSGRWRMRGWRPRKRAAPRHVHILERATVDIKGMKKDQLVNARDFESIRYIEIKNRQFEALR